MKKIFFLLTILTITVTAQNKWVIDRSHSYVNFSVSHMVISDVTGTFNDFITVVNAAKDDFSDATISVAIKAKSVDTGNEKRDNHLRSKDFFNTDKDSIMTFTSKSIQKLSDTDYKITGDLTMRGVTKQVVLNTKYKGRATNPWGQTIAAFKGNTVINRKDFGLEWNKALEAGGFLVGDNVEITIAVELIKDNG